MSKLDDPVYPGAKNTNRDINNFINRGKIFSVTLNGIDVDSPTFEHRANGIFDTFATEWCGLKYFATGGASRPEWEARWCKRLGIKSFDKAALKLINVKTGEVIREKIFGRRV